jgi:hypothetical protein
VILALITLGVFDNCHFSEKAPKGSSIQDSRIRKVMIRLACAMTGILIVKIILYVGLHDTLN